MRWQKCKIDSKESTIIMLNSSNQQKILITGSAGFIGINLVKALSVQHTVIAGIHRQNTKKMTFQEEKLMSIAQPSSIISGNVADDFISLNELRKLDIDVVIYSAGQCDVNQAAKEWDKDNWKNTTTMQTNAFGPKRLAETCSRLAEKKNSPIKFIFLSSIYAEDVQQNIHHCPDHSPEKHYGYSKRFGEQLLENFPLLDVTIIRLPRMFGPHQNTAALACRLREEILFGKKLSPLNDNKMTLTPVEALNTEILFLLETPSESGRYTIKKLSPELEITTSSREIAEIFDQIISKRLSFTPFFQEITRHNPKLSHLFEEIIENRVEHFEDATKTIQKTWRNYKSRTCA